MNDITKENHQLFSPLSYGQRALLFLYQTSPASRAYNIFITVRINSELDVKSLHWAWQKIFERHPILRTTYTIYKGEPVQQIHEQQEVYIQITNASNWSEDYLKEQIFVEADRPFDLEKGPVLRLNLFTCTPKEHILLVTMHHIAGDMWSFDILLNELQVLYTDETEDSLPKSLTYTEYVRRQSEMLSSSQGEKLWEYWQQQLGGELPILNLPTDRPRPPVQTYNGASHTLKVDEEVTAALNSLAQTEEVSVYTILLSAFQVLLYRYSGQEEILVGTPIAGRSREFKGTIGYFVNPVVLRRTFSKYPTFTEFLTQNHRTIFGAIKHQFYPFPLLVERLQPQRDPSRSPLYQVSFTSQKHRWWDLEKKSDPKQRKKLQMEPYLLGHQRGAPFDLNVMVMQAGELIQICWQYNSDLFDAATIARMAEHFQTLLAAIVDNPQQRLSELPLLSVAERQQILVEWNNTQADYPQDLCIHQLLEVQVEKTPQAVAVVSENQHLTYRELNNRANKIAHYLLSVGVRPEVLVGICVERSPLMVMGLLGILKAGGAYVPLDPRLPQERLTFMLEDAQISVLLTEQSLLESDSIQGIPQTICLDTDWEIIARQSESNPAPGVVADNLAYVIYTSGSTGKPKGVMLSHRSLCNHMFWMQATFPLTEKDKVLQKTPFSFDASVWEFYAPLLAGAQLLLAKPGGHQDSAYLLKLIAEHKVTTVQLVPSLLQMLLEQGGIETCDSLKHVFCGGEALPVALQEGLLTNLNVNLHNLYGPTEACIDATAWTCKRGIDGLVPIGRPISNTQIYILDRHGQPVPIGVTGELHIGGAGLARGYFNRPELTAERFIPNPFSNELGARLYKTGDLARYLPDGNIEFLGRIDRQVKIRGFRIELEEIEAVLSQHPSVRQTVVTTWEDLSGNKRLVAYVVPNQESGITTNELRSFLKQRLPEYMVPVTNVFLESLPLTPNGKVDRRALRAPDIHSGLESTFVAPRTPTEKILSRLWAEVLGVEKVGIDDNFFELGGHSLLATLVISRLREAFQVELPQFCLFTSPTVAQLSEVISAEIQTGSGVTVPAIAPVPREQNLPLSWAQQRLWFLQQLEGESSAYKTPVVLRLTGNLNIPALSQALQAILQRHEVLRTHFQIVAEQPVQVIIPHVTLTLPLVDLQGWANPWQQVQQQLTLATQQPFDLTNGPIMRATLWQLSPQEYVLLVTIHHIAADGWSVGVLSRELSAHYQAASPLPDLPIQYADFAVWQRQYLTNTVLEPQLRYWKQQLADAPALLTLPTDRPRPQIQTFRGNLEQFQIDNHLVQQLKHLGQRRGATLFMTLLTAFVVLLYRYSGQTDLVLGSPIANRNRQEIEPLIGFFVNTLALRFDLSTEQTFEALLAQVQRLTLDAYAHQDIPFEILVEELQPERRLDYNPIVQVMFTLQNAPPSSWNLPDLSVEQILVDTGVVRFYLEVNFWQVPFGLNAAWYYSSDLFDRTTIVRIHEHFQNLLTAIVAHPQQSIDKLPLLTAAQQQQLLVEWNVTQTDYPRQCIHELFAAQVEKTPDAVAVTFVGQQLTYRELNERANQLAHYLQSLGVGTETLVGLCVERSLDVIIAFLAILKAGGAYLPLDPNSPPDRLFNILQDASVTILLTQRQFLGLSVTNISVICLDDDSWRTSQPSQVNPITSVTADNLAYVMYTSGSTGQPKGVMVPHGAVIRLVLNTDYVNLQSSDVIAQVSHTSFDAATFEIWGALLNGASLVILQRETVLSPREFANSLRTEGITTLFLTTALFNQMIQSEPLAFQSLRLLLFGGETADPRRVRQALEVGAPQQLLHVYGPTENTTFSTWYRVEQVDPEAETIPIGQAIANTQTYILDRHLQPVPIGVPGELYLGGAGLARGYFNLPELTLERFIPHPFKDGQRLYKTGDRARYLPNGQIEFLGRLDNQVKIRGFRIEPTEVEAVLNQHPLVKASVVVVKEDTVCDKHLVAYVVSDTRHQLEQQLISEIRQFLQQKLPEYMRPQLFVLLDELPKTRNGKIDRRSLPDPNLQDENLSTSFKAPRTPTEAKLAAIWTSVLKRESIGVNHNFFELGGHSLLATQVISRINSAFELNLSVINLFASPTIAEIATYIEFVHWTPQEKPVNQANSEEVEF